MSFNTVLKYLGGDRPSASLEESQRNLRESKPSRAREPGAARHARGAHGAAGAGDRSQDGAPRQLHTHRPAQVRPECIQGATRKPGPDPAR